jgi:hypothetical protein
VIFWVNANIKIDNPTPNFFSTFAPDSKKECEDIEAEVT